MLGQNSKGLGVPARVLLWAMASIEVPCFSWVLGSPSGCPAENSLQGQELGRKPNGKRKQKFRISTKLRSSEALRDILEVA